MKEKIAELIDLKTIITISITVALVIGFFEDKLSAENFFTIVTMVFTYYFAKKDKTVENKVEEEPKNNFDTKDLG